MQIQTA